LPFGLLLFRRRPVYRLTYGGLGTALGLRELVGGATPTVSISQPASDQLRIDLGAQTFRPKSTAQATGLSYEHPGVPGASHFATVDISQAHSIAVLEATLPGDKLTLGVIPDASVCVRLSSRGKDASGNVGGTVKTPRTKPVWLKDATGPPNTGLLAVSVRRAGLAPAHPPHPARQS
jgi:hypothetical protein